jgi:hypothetical protein
MCTKLQKICRSNNKNMPNCKKSNVSISRLFKNIPKIGISGKNISSGNPALVQAVHGFSDLPTPACARVCLQVGGDQREAQDQAVSGNDAIKMAGNSKDILDI